MRVCLLNTYDREGGAARACLRLRQGLQGAGLDASLLVREKSLDDPSIHSLGPVAAGRLRDLFDYLPLKLYPHRQAHNFSRAKMPSGVVKTVRRFAPDLVHLHWIPHGFVTIEDLAAFPVPIVWTLHDSWPFTGGCHLPGACRRFEKTCGSCPVLGSGQETDLSRRIWNRKQRSYPAGRMTIVAPSRWMAGRAHASSLLRGCSVEVIPNGLDTDFYSPGDKAAARSTLGLPHGRTIILFGAKSACTDANKGFDLLCEALGKLPAGMDSRPLLVLFGDTSQPAPSLPGVDVVDRGVISDDAILVALYRAADLLVLPSRQENLPNMISEAMACALPCVAFAVGGIPDQLLHRHTGCLAVPHDPEALAIEIAWLLERAERRDLLGAGARAHALEHYSLTTVARRHLTLYERLLHHSPA